MPPRPIGPADPTPPIPPRDPKEVLEWARHLSEFIVVTLRKYVRKDTMQDSVLLASPNGSVYTVKVTDLGVLEVTLVRSL